MIVDEERHSRQIFTWGLSAQHLISSASICVHGSDFIAVECLRMLILCGVSNVSWSVPSGEECDVEGTLRALSALLLPSQSLQRAAVGGAAAAAVVATAAWPPPPAAPPAVVATAAWDGPAVVASVRADPRGAPGAAAGGGGAAVPPTVATAVAAVAAHAALRMAAGASVNFSVERRWEAAETPGDGTVKDGVVAIVGAGAIGCEVLPLLARMHVGGGPRGQIVVVDPDRIERSNLSRQALFRESDVGEYKAEVAAKAMRRMHPQAKIRALCIRVDNSSFAQRPFGHAFWKSANCIIGAVDNNRARSDLAYIARLYDIPYIDCGTEGPMGHIDPIVPHTTSGYMAATDGPSLPMCTVHFFPTRYEHCVHYATEAFAEFFAVRFQKVRSFAQAPSVAVWVAAHPHGGRDVLAREIRSALGRVTDVDGEGAAAAVAAVEVAVEFFEDLFGGRIRRLLDEHNPSNEEGRTFWGEHKVPSVVEFDVGDGEHRAFIVSTAKILALCRGVVLKEEDIGIALNMRLTAVTVNERFDNEGIAQASFLAETDLHRLHVMAKAVEDRIVPALFSADDSCHAQWVATCANIRAGQYQLQKESIWEARRIAGRIIPAILTATAAVAAEVVMTCVHILRAGDLKGDSAKWASLRFESRAVTMDNPNNGCAFDSNPPRVFSFEGPLGKRTFSEWEYEEILDTKGMSVREIVDLLENVWRMKIAFLVDVESCSILYNSNSTESAENERKFAGVLYDSRGHRLPVALVTATAMPVNGIVMPLPSVRWRAQFHAP